MDNYQQLIEISNDAIRSAGEFAYKRKGLFGLLEPLKNHVMILKGARGIGKSTLIQQFLLDKQREGHSVLYLSADSTLLDLGLAEFAHLYYKRGGEYLAFDEIHKYDNWQAEVKTIVDAFPTIKLIVSGSSSLKLDYARVDLSRRHIMIHAKGLSFREYANKNYQLNLETLSLNEILKSPNDFAMSITRIFQTHQLDLLSVFSQYLREGYFLTRDNYPKKTLYYDSLLQVIHSIVESDLASTYHDIDGVSVRNIKRLLRHIALKCPFTPNITELSRHLTIKNDNVLKKYLFYLHEGEVLLNLYPVDKSHKDFQKPQKIFLHNTNLAYAYSQAPLIGTIRETFVANCLQGLGELTAPKLGDFCLDQEYIFEIGGRSKNKRQIKSIAKSFVFADDILSVERDNIPLWLLGFLW